MTALSYPNLPPCWSLNTRPSQQWKESNTLHLKVFYIKLHISSGYETSELGVKGFAQQHVDIAHS